MPVTAKLSKAFYQKLGHEVTDELVDYLNDVDAAYRADLRDLNELNFARFDAKLEQRIAELRGEFQVGLAAVRNEIGGLRTDLKGEVADVRNEMRAVENRLLTWMFAAWATTIGTLITLLRLWG
jgi:hypothetical protein